MKKHPEFADIIQTTAETVVGFFTRQAQQLARLVQRKPKKRTLSWDAIIDESLAKKRHAPAALESELNLQLPEINQQLALLPPGIIEELISRIELNTIDEVQAIRLYEKLYECEVQIIRGHVHFYKSNSENGSENIDYTVLKNRLLQKFVDHQQLVAAHMAASSSFHP